MTVAEAIAQLQQLNPDARLVLVVDYSTFETTDVASIEPHLADGHGYEEVLVW